MTVVIKFDLAERWRIGAIEVLPGEEQRTCLVLASKTHSLEGCVIVWFLIDMHDFGAYLVHNLAELRVVMQVKVAIEGYGGDDHAIAACIEAFKNLFATVVALPVLGCHQSQFDARTFRQLFELTLRGPCDQGF